MKKLLAAVSLAIGLGFAAAQTTQVHTTTVGHPVQKTTTATTVKKSNGKTAVVKSTTTKDVTPKVVAKTVKTALDVHLKADGTPDMRYKNAQHLKKDGTPDMRYKENHK